MDTLECQILTDHSMLLGVAGLCHEFLDNFTGDDGKTIKYREILVGRARVCIW